MSDTTKQKVYVPGTSVKEHKFPDGGSVLRVGINLEKFAPFVKQHKNERGYINFDINLRKEVGPYGDTHNISLNTWVKPENTTATEPKTKSTKPVEKKEIKKTAPAPEPEEEFV